MFECAVQGGGRNRVILWWSDITRKWLNGADRECREVLFIHGVTMIYLCRRKVRREAAGAHGPIAGSSRDWTQ